MKDFVTVVYSDDFDDDDYVVAIYDNPEHADHDYPWNYKERKYLRTKPRNYTPVKGNNGDIS